MDYGTRPAADCDHTYELQVSDVEGFVQLPAVVFKSSALTWSHCNCTFVHEEARLSLERLTPPRIIPIRAVGRPRSYARCRHKTILPSVLLIVQLFWQIWLASSPPRSLRKQGNNAHYRTHGYTPRQSMESEARGNIICGVHSQSWAARSEVWVNLRPSPVSHQAGVRIRNFEFPTLH